MGTARTVRCFTFRRECSTEKYGTRDRMVRHGCGFPSCPDSPQGWDWSRVDGRHALSWQWRGRVRHVLMTASKVQHGEPHCRNAFMAFPERTDSIRRVGEGVA